MEFEFDRETLRRALHQKQDELTDLIETLEDRIATRRREYNNLPWYKRVVTAHPSQLGRANWSDEYTITSLKLELQDIACRLSLLQHSDQDRFVLNEEDAQEIGLGNCR